MSSQTPAASSLERDFADFDRPMSALAKTVEGAVNSLPDAAGGAFLSGLLATTKGSYSAVCALNADKAKERFATDSYVVVRGMLESYFSLLLWRQNPKDNGTWFWKSSWLDADAELKLDEELERYDPGLRERIEARKVGRGILVRMAGLTQAELSGDKRIEAWPVTPGKMIRQVSRWASETERGQAQRLYDLLYPSLSRLAHPSFTATAMRWTYAEGKKKNPTVWLRAVRMMEVNAVYYAWVVVTMTLTELVLHLNVGQMTQLKSLWNWLADFRPQTRAYYEARFAAILGAL